MLYDFNIHFFYKMANNIDLVETCSKNFIYQFVWRSCYIQSILNTALNMLLVWEALDQENEKYQAGK